MRQSQNKLVNLAQIIIWLLCLLLLNTACNGQSTPTPTLIPTQLPVTPTIAATATPNLAVIDQQTVVYSLLADNTLVGVRAKDGSIFVQETLAPAPPAGDYRFPGHYLVLSRDSKDLYVLAPGSLDEPCRLVVVETASGKIKANYLLANSQGRLTGINPSRHVYNSLTIGQKSGNLYLFGTRGAAVIVTLIDPKTGAELKNWLAKDYTGVDFMAYKGLVSEDETKIYISYHNYNSAGIDIFEVKAASLEACKPIANRQSGCVKAHGNVIFYGEGLLLATGDSVLLETDKNGTTKRGYDTNLETLHQREFVIDNTANRLYVAGSCQAGSGKTGGISIVDLGKAAFRQFLT